MPPADQRLGADDLAVGKRHDRLVQDGQLVRLECRAQLRLDLEPAAHALVHARLEEGEAPLAGGFCRVHRHVGVAQQVAAVAALPGQGDADARPHQHRGPVQVERLGEVGDDALGDPRGAVGVGALQQHRELVAAEPGRGVLGPQAGAQALRHRDQQRVTHGMPKAVVDPLEVIEVDEQHG
jgi:hypothetical protein